MIVDGKWMINTTCARCHFRHPKELTCAAAKVAALTNRSAYEARIQYTFPTELLAYLHRQIDPLDPLNPRYGYVRAHIAGVQRALTDFVARNSEPTLWVTGEQMKHLSDMSAPTDIQRKYLEKDLQKQCVDWARARGYWARKFSSISQRSVPDYLFSRKTEAGWFELSEQRVKFACEFKKPGTKPKLIKKYGVTVMSTEAQYEEQLAMREAGWLVFECDDFEKFKATVIAYENELQRSEVEWL